MNTHRLCLILGPAATIIRLDWPLLVYIAKRGDAAANRGAAEVARDLIKCWPDFKVRDEEPTAVRMAEIVG
jgi:hypothetical protein